MAMAMKGDERDDVAAAEAVQCNGERRKGRPTPEREQQSNAIAISTRNDNKDNKDLHCIRFGHLLLCTPFRCPQLGAGCSRWD